jgi:outer membrane protein assembly factor BamB
MRNKIKGEEKYMKFSRSKTTTTAIALILMFAMAVSLFALPTANAQIPEGMYWDLPQTPSSTRLLLWERYKDKIPTWTFSVITPNPVGVGQRISIVMFNPQQPWAASAINDIRYSYSVTIVRPDGTTETLPPSGTFTSDATGTSFTHYTPDQVGNYTITVKFHELFYRWHGSSSERDYYGVTYLESSYTKTVVVQEEEVLPTGWNTVPLPTEYWTRPIEGENTQWYQVASNWLASEKDKNNMGSENRYQQDGIAPNSAHILWTKPVEDGGLVGGGNFSVPGEVFNAGHQYQTRFTNPIIMWGRLYYEVPITWSGGGGGWMCVDLRTGEDLWGGPKDFGSTEFCYPGWGCFRVSVSPSFGYYYDLDTMNDHGVVTPGWMFTNNFAQSIHPRYGILGQLNLTDVPSGFEVVGPKGEHLRYVLNNAGNMSHPNYRLVQWNSSNVFTSQTGERNASIVRDQNLDWNVSAPWRNGMTGGDRDIVVRAVQYGDVLIGSNGSHPTGTSSTSFHYPTPVTFWAISLKPESRGSLLWMKNIDTVKTEGGVRTLLFERAGEGVLVFVWAQHREWVGYSMYTGEKLWETGPESDFNPFGYYSFPSLIHVASTSIAYGKLFTAGYTGAVHCYDLNNGTLLWRYEAPTNMEIFKYYTLMLGAVADGKIYVGTHEHSADTPLFKGNRIRCLNVTTGEEIWTMSGWAHPYTFAVADGILIYWNNYDHQVYAVGKGPSATTVTASPKISVHGSNVLVEGTVMDISAGTKQNEQAARFPIGVPAVSEESMSDWMEYVYIQKPRPSNVTGVEVVLTVLDPNTNYYEVGRTTSDANGFFSCVFTPEVPGKYTIIATFEGSEGYWSSHAETAVFVEETPAATPAPTPTPAPMTDTYILGSTIGIIIAVIIGFALLLLRKR